jgi:uncharacterized protein
MVYSSSRPKPVSETEGSAMSLDDQLLRLLACPIDKEALLYFPDEGVLYNPRLRRSYRVETGIPVLLADHSETATTERHDDLVSRGGALATLGREPAQLVQELPAPAE